MGFISPVLAFNLRWEKAEVTVSQEQNFVVRGLSSSLSSVSNQPCNLLHFPSLPEPKLRK